MLSTVRGAGEMARGQRWCAALLVVGLGCGPTARGGEAHAAHETPHVAPKESSSLDAKAVSIKEPTSSEEPQNVADRTSSAEASPATAPNTPEPSRGATIESVSLGSPNYGSLEGAVALPLQAPGLRYNPRRQDAARYGTTEMIAALVRAAGRVAQEMPGGEVTINDLSYREGGPIEHHGSHQSGRDVDVLFYFLGEDGHPKPSVGAPVEPNGRAVDFRDLADPDDDVPLQIDLPRTWLFVQAVIEDDSAGLQRIFLVEHLRTMLLGYAERIGAPPSTIERFGEMTCQPSYPHDDHFHFRFFCEPGDIALGCRDTKPIYPWRVDALAERGLEPQLADGRRRKAKTTTAAEARAAAGPMHEEVVALLERRKAWSDRPRPGRRYCR